MGTLIGVLWGLLAGTGIGVVFFLGLWATVRRVTSSRQPHVWLAGRFVLRMVVVGIGLWLVARGGLLPLVGALLGFVVARPLVSRLVVSRRGEPQS